MTASASTPEVLVVGGGPVGLATALGCRAAGLSVEVVERRSGIASAEDGQGLDKPCGEGLLPPALAALQRLRVEVPVGHAIEGIRWTQRDPPADAVGRFLRPGRGVRRPELHAALRRAAEEAGAVVGEETFEGLVARAADGRGPRTAHRVPHWGVRTDRRRLAPRWVVGADGLRSPVRRAAGLEAPSPASFRRRPARRFGVRVHFARGPWSPLVEVHWADGCEAYVTPVGEGEVGVALLWSSASAGEGGERDLPIFDRLLRRFPALVERLDGCERTSRPLGCGPLLQPTRGTVSGNLALVGDAAGYLDAITGEGLALGFEQAELLAACLERGDLRPYDAAGRRARRVPDVLTRLALLLSRRPGLRRRVVTALAARPERFSTLLDTLTGAAPLRAAGPTLLRLGLASLGATTNPPARSELR